MATREEINTMRARLTALQDQLYSGVSSVSVGGETTTFVQPNEARRLVVELQNAIASATGTARVRPRAASISLGGT